MSQGSRMLISQLYGNIWKKSGQILQKTGMLMAGGEKVFPRETMQLQTRIMPFNGISPLIDSETWVAAFTSLSFHLDSNSCIIGDVRIKRHSCIWYNTILRADTLPIWIGIHCQILDGVMITNYRESNKNQFYTSIHNQVVIFPNSVLRGCIINNNCFVGACCTIEPGTIMQKESWLSHNSHCAPNTIIGSRQLWSGNPARYIRDLNVYEIDWIRRQSHSWDITARTHSESDNKDEYEQEFEMRRLFYGDRLFQSLKHSLHAYHESDNYEVWGEHPDTFKAPNPVNEINKSFQNPDGWSGYRLMKGKFARQFVDRTPYDRPPKDGEPNYNYFYNNIWMV